MTLLAIRTERGLTLKQVAVELGLSASSSGWISEIENGRKDASVRLALRIEAWTGGVVSAPSVCRELRKALYQGVAPASVEDPQPMAPPAPFGAGAKSGEMQ